MSCFRTDHFTLHALLYMLLQLAAAQDGSLSLCPTCYTSTIWIAPPCVPPISCTGPPTPPAGEECTRTVDLRPTNVTITIPGFNPACPTTPRTTSYLSCPPTPACSASLCTIVTLGVTLGESVEVTVTEAPMGCVATTTYTIPPPPTTRSISFDTTITPPPFPIFPPDEDMR